jgi:ABC-2 type transport system permease protein
MLVLILLYGSAYSIHGVGEDFLEQMGGRLRCTPVKLYKQFIGKMLGIVVLLILQAGIVILFTKYVYKANWGSDIFGVFSIVATMAMFITTLGGMLTLLLRNRMAANGLINVVIPVTTFLSGGYAYIPLSGGWYDTVRQLLPNSLAQNGLFSIIYKSPFVQQDLLKGVLTQFQLSMVFLWGMIAVMLIVTVLAGRRRMA